jgi:hypothetical protein
MFKMATGEAEKAFNDFRFIEKYETPPLTRL